MIRQAAPDDRHVRSGRGVAVNFDGHFVTSESFSPTNVLALPCGRRR